MRFIIHGTASDGSEDFIVVEGDTIEEIREKADKETSKRGWTNLWSEEIT